MHKVKQIFDIILRVIGGLTLVIVLYLPLEWYFSSHAPEKLDSISDFRDWQPNVKTAQMISFDDVTYYGVLGPHTRHLSSGPSAYYFDANGLYLTMNRDLGDSPYPWLLHPNNRLGVRTRIDIGDIPDKAEQIAKKQPLTAP